MCGYLYVLSNLGIIDFTKRKWWQQYLIQVLFHYTTLSPTFHDAPKEQAKQNKKKIWLKKHKLKSYQNLSEKK